MYTNWNLLDDTLGRYLQNCSIITRSKEMDKISQKSWFVALITPHPVQQRRFSFNIKLIAKVLGFQKMVSTAEKIMVFSYAYVYLWNLFIYENAPKTLSEILNPLPRLQNLVFEKSDGVLIEVSFAGHQAVQHLLQPQGLSDIPLEQLPGLA